MSDSLNLDAIRARAVWPNRADVLALCTEVERLRTVADAALAYFESNEEEDMWSRLRDAVDVWRGAT